MKLLLTFQIFYSCDDKKKLSELLRLSCGGNGLRSLFFMLLGFSVLLISQLL